MKSDDTIIAVSSPPGRSARGLLRISGPRTRAILSQILEKTPTSHDREGAVGPQYTQETDSLTVAARQICAVRIFVDADPSLGSNTIPALLVFFQGPQSYTGQDCAEIQLPGNPALLDRLLHRACASGGGARLAEPGEFTMRAFLAGKMDLTQAEGVAATIAAQSDGQLRAAGLLRDGALTKLSHKIVDHLATQLALVESGIDFVDQDDVVPIGAAALDAALAQCEIQLNELLTHSRSWSAIEALPRVVLVGKPSSGKSTLFNALLGRQRAVISHTPGTTRDSLVEPITLHNAQGLACEALLVDIAGLDSPVETMVDGLDELVQQAAHRAIESADVILLINDGRGAEKISSHAPVLHVRTKADLISKNISENEKAASPQADVQVCALSGVGLEKLRHMIEQRLTNRLVSVSESMLTLQPRHEAALRTALQSLREARETLAQQSMQQQAIDHVELVAGSLRSALDELAALGGEMTPDDIIGRVFATFCVGK